MRTFLTAMALLVCVIGTAVSKRVSAMSRKIMLVLVAAAALAAVPIANAVAFSGGVFACGHAPACCDYGRRYGYAHHTSHSCYPPA